MTDRAKELLDDLKSQTNKTLLDLKNQINKVLFDLVAENEELEEQLTRKGEWIPVSERLPDEEHEVYCQLSDGSNAVLYV